MQGVISDLTRQTFGRLSVLRRDGSNRHAQATWWVQCTCGSAMFSVTGGALKKRQYQIVWLSSKRIRRLSWLETRERSHWATVWSANCASSRWVYFPGAVYMVGSMYLR